MWYVWFCECSTDAAAGSQSACLQVCHFYSWVSVFERTFLLLFLLCSRSRRTPLFSIHKALPKLAGFYASLLNHSHRLGYITAPWKRVFIKLLLKVNAPSSPSNTRPVSNLCEISKMLERILHKQITDNIATNNKFDPRQAGFRADLPLRLLYCGFFMTFGLPWIRSASPFWFCLISVRRSIQ